MKRLLILSPLALAACVQSGADVAPPRSPLAEPPPEAQTAFDVMDERLGHRNARMGYDQQNCLTYNAADNIGRVSSSPLLNDRGERICMN